MTLKLTATKRTKKAVHERNEDRIPAVLYGHGLAAVTLALPATPFLKMYREAGESTLLDVVIDGGTSQKALIHDVQYHPLTNRITHVDLYAVRMTEKMKTKVALRFVGDAPAVKQKGGLLVKNLDHVNVSCLPKDLVSEIQISISGLLDYGNSIYVKDIPAPAGITILDKPEEPVVTVMRPKTEEELQKELAVETGDVKVEDAVKVQEKGKKEEEGEEGAAGAAKDGEKKPTEKKAEKKEEKKK
ncbi:50S ribosomal protein L25 [Candidatus Uhrbacteria bacterium]|nr:50S ribosomal protein L25 [Candidatus Uhrbacteria bacterium]